MNMSAFVWRLIMVALAKYSYMAVVTGTSGNQVTVTVTGHGLAGTFPRLASYSSPTNGDNVWCIRIGNKALVVGKILT